MKADVANIVATQEFFNQSAAIPPTTLFTPAADGTFRVSAYVETGNTDTSTGVAVALRWTNDFRVEGTTGSDFSASGAPLTGPVQGPGFGDNWKVFVLHAKAGTPIQISTTDASAANGIAAPYNLFVFVEQF